MECILCNLNLPTFSAFMSFQNNPAGLELLKFSLSSTVSYLILREERKANYKEVLN